LQIRGCKGFLKLLKANIESGSEAHLVLGSEGNSGSVKTFGHSDAPAAMEMFAEWVTTGKLGPLMKHKSSVTSPWSLLYFMAQSLAGEALCNPVINELIGRYYQTNTTPNVQEWRNVSEMGDGSPSRQLQDFFLHYFAANFESLETDATLTSGWDGLGCLQHELFIHVLQICRGRASHLRYPTMKTKCKFHVHQETQPCND
jgi:hypothetical protein